MKQFFKKIIIILLEWEARLVLRKYKPRIIAVTGNVGKTTTKDVIYTVLSPSFHVRKSKKSYNSEIGIPLTILGLGNAWSNPAGWLHNLLSGLELVLFSRRYPRVLVLEVGADRPGDIAKVAKWLRPERVVLTRFPDVPVHVEFFESPEDVVKEKLELVQHMRTGGEIVANHDDKAMRALKPPPEGFIITYGFSEGADLVASNEEFTYENGVVSGMTFRIDHAGHSVPVSLSGVLGRQHIYPVLAAFALGIKEGLNMVDMGKAVSEHEPPPGRMRLVQGENGSIIIDDTYNSSPLPAEMALDVIKKIKTSGRKIVVLGDMMELGSYSTEAHKNIGKAVAGVADLLITVGIRSQYTAEEAHKSGMKKRDILVFSDAIEAGNGLAENRKLEADDVVLVKGSQSMRMERVVECIMAEPEKKRELLVRQDVEWQRIP